MLKTIQEQLQERTSALSVKELASMLGVSANTIYDTIKAGKLSVMRIGTTVRIDPRAAATWLDSITT